MAYHLSGRVGDESVGGHSLGEEGVEGARRFTGRNQYNPQRRRSYIKIKGVQLLKNKGNHVVLLRVKIPTHLSDKQRKIFQ
jgi:hypothetical protein